MLGDDQRSRAGRAARRLRVAIDAGGAVLGRLVVRNGVLDRNDLRQQRQRGGGCVADTRTERTGVRCAGLLRVVMMAAERDRHCQQRQQ